MGPLLCPLPGKGCGSLAGAATALPVPLHCNSRAQGDLLSSGDQIPPFTGKHAAGLGCGSCRISPPHPLCPAVMWGWVAPSPFAGCPGQADEQWQAQEGTCPPCPPCGGTLHWWEPEREELL